MTIAFFLGPNLFSLFKKSLAIFVIEQALSVLMVGLDPFASAGMFSPSLLFDLFYLFKPVFTIFYGLLAAGAIRAILKRILPDPARRLKIFDDRYIIGLFGTKQAGMSWIWTPVTLAAFVIFTVSLLAGFLVQELDIHYSDYEAVRGHYAAVALIGLFLSVLGFLSGARFVSGAKASVGKQFGVQYLSHDHWLSQRVADLAGKLGLESRPEVGVTEVMNAFAMGRRTNSVVVIGKPLIEALTPEELDAVIGHELGHIHSSDMQRMQFAEGFQRMLGNVVMTVTTLSIGAIARRKSDVLLGQALGNLFRVTLFVGSELAVKALSRSREFVADEIGARLSSPQAMISALERVHGIPSEVTEVESRYGYLMFKGGWGMLFATHPKLEARVNALRHLEEKRPESDHVSDENPDTPPSEAGARVEQFAETVGRKSAKLASASLAHASQLTDKAAKAGEQMVTSTQKATRRLSWPRIRWRVLGTLAAFGALTLLAAPAVFDYYRVPDHIAAAQTSLSNAYGSVTGWLAAQKTAVIDNVLEDSALLARKDQEIAQRDDQIDDLRRSVDDLSGIKMQLESRISSLTTLLAEKTASLDQLAGAATVPTVSSDDKRTIELLKQNNVNLTSQLTALQLEYDRLKMGTNAPPSGFGALQNEIAALKDRSARDGATIARLSQQNTTLYNEVRDLRGRTRQLEEDLKAARVNSTSSELKAQIAQQKSTIITLRKQLDERTAPSTGSEDTATLRLLKDRNTQLTEETSQQRATITALRQDIESLKFKIQQQEAQLNGRPAESTYEVLPAPAEQGSWVAAAVSETGSVEVSTNQASRKAAINAAVDLCVERGGQECNAIEVYPKGCIAVARPRGVRILPNNFWLGNDRSSMEAQGKAIEQCFNANGGRYTCDTAFVRCSN